MEIREHELFKDATAKTFDNAHNLRRRLTGAEALLWEYLRGRKLEGLKFRRQHPVDVYIADFYCAEHQMVVELDGGVHDDEEARDYDAGRTKKLEELGVRVIRFTNEEVMSDVEGVLRKIGEFILIKNIQKYECRRNC